jgi:hypothetical protein
MLRANHGKQIIVDTIVTFQFGEEIRPFFQVDMIRVFHQSLSSLFVEAKIHFKLEL